MAAQTRGLIEADEAKILREMNELIEPEEDIIDAHDQSQVASFYTDRSVFITGASGFVGKCLLEKLLRSCPNLKTVYILMRPKRGVGIEDRTIELLKSKLFDRLRLQPSTKDQLSKVRPVDGDITRPYLGLSEADIKELSSEVSVVFHSAATVKFEEPMNTAVENNVVSVDNMIVFASKLERLEALVHVSTAYSNCDRPEVDEIFYEAPIQADKLIDMSRWMNSKTLERVAPGLMDERPNSYTYTKAVAESLLRLKSEELLPNVPIAMVRPSIVAGIWRGPIRGWVDNFNGPTGVLLAMMSGFLQGMHVRPDYNADIVPVDMVANLIICAAWKVHQEHQNKIRIVPIPIDQRSEDSGGELGRANITIYNCVSSSLNPLNWGTFCRRIHIFAKKFPINDSLRPAGSLLMSNEFLFKIYNFANHTCIAYIGDLVLKLNGKKSKLVPLHYKLMKMIKILRPFTINQWLFNCSNTTGLFESMSTLDQKIFNFDVRQLVWTDYLPRYYVGSKIFVVKDDLKKTKKTRQKLIQIEMCGKLAQTMIIILAYYILVMGTSLEASAVDIFKSLLSL